MLVLGVTASILAPIKVPPEPGSASAGIMVCYFVATSWVTARRRKWTTGTFEIVACASVLDLNAILRKKLTAAQRISRHLWRMCFASFAATGSFFLGQQDVGHPQPHG